MIFIKINGVKSYSTKSISVVFVHVSVSVFEEILPGEKKKKRPGNKVVDE
jgi:hypothetical protein